MAAKARTLGRRRLREVATIVTPETLQPELPERSGADRTVTSSRTTMVVMPDRPYWIREEQLDGWHCLPASWLSRFHAVVVVLCDAPPFQEKDLITRRRSWAGATSPV